MSSDRSLDIVIPVYNEQTTLPRLIERLQAVFPPPALTAAKITSPRFLFVDDGSTDSSAAILVEKIRQGWKAKLLCLSRNFGHQQAIAAGLDQSTADVVAVMDADLQDPPELILDMVRQLDHGFDIVYGKRQNRQEPFYMRLLYAMFYRVYRFLSDVDVPVDAGDFCVMKREVVLALRSLPETLRFQRGLRSWIGYRQSALTYDRPAREFGDSKYTLPKLYKLATDGIASLSIRPLRITQVFLFLSVLATLAFFGLTTFFYLRSNRTDTHLLWFLATQGMVAFTASLQLFGLYILGAYVGRMYLEVKSRPTYIVMKTVSPPGSE